jgi:hypothetical protein
MIMIIAAHLVRGDDANDDSPCGPGKPERRPPLRDLQVESWHAAACQPRRPGCLGIH